MRKWWCVHRCCSIAPIVLSSCVSLFQGQAPKKSNWNRHGSSSGFTLIEIMVVVFILGLLISIVAPKIVGRTDEARRTKAAADLRMVQQGLLLYKLDNASYPTTEQGLEALA